ncbi:DUF3618 domain-containing protein [Phytohabitans sp. LJ34]|uniref:DUF3618 domain-containing protein n=1 Tax=Phytohabitans sp. LJ34 TaxID=3452217 RepID=UPI003F89B3F9
MSTDPDQIRREIARTREELSDDVDALAYKADPRRMVHDRKERVRHTFRRMSDTVMGTASQVTAKGGEAASGASDKVSAAVSTVGDAAAAAPGQIKRQAEGNPIAAGLIAFGVGWLVSSLLPASEREKEAAERLKAVAQDHADTIKEEVGGVAQEMRDNLREPAQQAAQSVRSTAEDAARSVKDEARSATDDVRDEVREAGHQVRS